MQKLTMVAAVAALMLATPAFAQNQPSEPGTMQMSDDGIHQTERLTSGKITEVDLGRGTLTLDTGMQFTIAPNFEFTSAPAVGQDVEVTYDEQNGQKVAHSIDVGGTSSRSGADQ